MLSVVNTCANEVTRRLTVSRLSGRLGRPSCWRCDWLVWKAGVPSVREWERWSVEWTVGEAGGGVSPGQCPSDHCPCCLPLGRESGDERTMLPFPQPWKDAKSTNYMKAILCLSSRAFLSNLILKVPGRISI